MKAQWTIGQRLLAAFLITSGITLALGLYGYYNAAHNDAAIEEIGSTRLPSVQNLLVISRCADRIAAAQRTLLSAELTWADRQAQLDAVTKAREEYEAAWKIYEPLPQTPEEEGVWKKFVPAWESWRAANTEFLSVHTEFAGLGIRNPQALQRDVQRFIGDHYKLDLTLQAHVVRGQECAGGEDPAACNFGQWLTTFESTNPELQRIVAAARPSHDRFHQAVKGAKGLVAGGDKEAAGKMIHEELEGAAGKTFESFTEMLAVAAKAEELRSRMSSQLMTVCRARQAEALGLLDELVDINEKVAAATATDAERQASLSKALSLGAAGVGVVAALVLGILLSRSINKLLGRVCDLLSAGSEQTASAAAQVSSTSQALAEGSSEQAASLEETSSSLEEMSSMTQRNAENARKANELARAARGAADRGAADMATMGEAMEAIKHSSADIAKILKTIDEIAFQTNILALNAAVEAARAGEAGAGFAVVADEVRSLAQRAALAAKETAEKIEGAINNSAKGVEVSSKVAGALEEIVSKARQVDELVSEVANASREQSQGITQVNTAVSQMDRVTQSNAASAEEGAAAAEELNAQAVTLKDVVRQLQQLVGRVHVADRTIPTAPAPTLQRKPPGPEPKTHGPGPGKVGPPAAGSVPARAVVPAAAAGDGDFKEF